MVVVAPAPWRVRSLVMSRSPCALASSVPAMVSVYVPAGRTMRSVPLPAGQPPKAVSVLAASIASRSAQPPPVPNSSAVVVTPMVAPRAGLAGWRARRAATARRTSVAARPRRVAGAMAGISLPVGTRPEAGTAPAGGGPAARPALPPVPMGVMLFLRSSPQALYRGDGRGRYHRVVPHPGPASSGPHASPHPDGSRRPRPPGGSTVVPRAAPFVPPRSEVTSP